MNIRPRGVRTRGHKGDGVGDVALYLLLPVIYELLAIRDAQAYSLRFDSKKSRSCAEIGSAGEPILGGEAFSND